MQFCFIVSDGKGVYEHLAIQTSFHFVVCFLLGDSPASEIYMPTFRNTLFHSTRTYLPMKMEQTECSETSAYKFQTPGNNPKESIQHSVHGESLKSRSFHSADVRV